MNDVEATTLIPACEACPVAPDVRTMYVHLLSGLVREVAGVTGVEVTQVHVVLFRGQEAPALFPRRDVYFACCEADQQPAPF